MNTPTVSNTFPDSLFDDEDDRVPETPSYNRDGISAPISDDHFPPSTQEYSDRKGKKKNLSAIPITLPSLDAFVTPPHRTKLVVPPAPVIKRTAVMSTPASSSLVKRLDNYGKTHVEFKKAKRRLYDKHTARMNIKAVREDLGLIRDRCCQQYVALKENMKAGAAPNHAFLERLSDSMVNTNALLHELMEVIELRESALQYKENLANTTYKALKQNFNECNLLK